MRVSGRERAQQLELELWPSTEVQQLELESNFIAKQFSNS